MKKILSLLLAIAMVLSIATVTMAYTEPYAVVFGSDSYEVEAGGIVSIPVYFFDTANPSTEVEIFSGEVDVYLTDGFTFDSITAGSVTDTELTSEDLYIAFIEEVDCSQATPLFTMNIVAPEEPGEYELAFDYYEMLDATANYYDVESNVTTITVTEAAPAGTSIEVLDAEGINEGYTANDFTVSGTLAQFTLFAKATNAAEYGIILSTEEFTKANIKEKNVWILAADDANEDGIFAVTAFEEKAADASFKKLTSASVWACAYAIDDAGEYVISNIIEY